MLKIEPLRPYIEALIGAGNLDENQAKTLVYYCIMTWSDKPQIRPIIDLHGESGTGKNGIMKQIKGWCRVSKWINARNKTGAQLRDDLADTTTAFVEEADKTREPKACENWYQQRFDETGRDITYKKPEISRKGYVSYAEETHNHFGYTVLHTQNFFHSVELDRRVLRITLFKNSNRLYTMTEGLHGETLAQIANEVDWRSLIPQPVSNSAWDVWLPLMRVAAHLEDDDFLGYAKKQIESKTEEDDLTKVFEPKGVVLSEIAPRYRTGLQNGNRRIAITTIREAINERGYRYDERQITKAAKELGFTIVYPHNKAHIKIVSEQQLAEITKKAGIAQEFCDEADVFAAEPVLLPLEN